MPAQRVGQRVPALRDKGRLRVGADVDITVFDAERIRDRSTYEKPAMYSEGVRYVLVNGVLVVKNGALQTSAVPGRAVRAPLANP